MGENSSALGSIPGTECLRSITPLAHLTLPKWQHNRIRELRPKLARFTDSPVVQLRQNTRIRPGNVGSMPIGRANFDGPLSLGYR